MSLKTRVNTALRGLSIAHLDDSYATGRWEGDSNSREWQAERRSSRLAEVIGPDWDSRTTKRLNKVKDPEVASRTMAKRFSEVTFPISALVGSIGTGQMGLPELQRPFVWERSQVRDFFDSLYRGYPTGNLLVWQAKPELGTLTIGSGQKQASPSLVVVDGQQRLTSLYSVFKGVPVLSKDFTESRIQIGFNPITERFEVANAVLEHDPEWIEDISVLLSGEIGAYDFTTAYLERLGADRDVSSQLKSTVAKNLGQIEALNQYTFNAIQISNDLGVDEVAEIFVRVNSKGTPLNQADFILTLMSVYWDEGRKDLEAFCRDAMKPSGGGASPFNWFIEPSPDQMLRVAIGLGHRRAQLKYAYELLRGKNLETGEISDENRTQSFELLRLAQNDVLDITNWQEYLKSLQEAGYRSGKMITSKNSIIFCYLVYLIGRCDFDLDHKTLRSAIARWFSMVMLTSRYTGSPESQVEKDIRRFAEANTGEEFLATIDAIIGSNLTNDYWEVALPDQLAWSGGYIPAMFAYVAAQNLLGGKVLFSKLTIHELLDPAYKAKKASLERHHLFPRGYLDSIGIRGTPRVNQVANYALLEWPDNNAIKDTPPSEYFPAMFEKYVPKSEEDSARFIHALPDGWEDMEYDKFLVERRRLIAKVVRAGFEKLATGIDHASAIEEATLSTADLIAIGESRVCRVQVLSVRLCEARNPREDNRWLGDQDDRSVLEHWGRNSRDWNCGQRYGSRD